MTRSEILEILKKYKTENGEKYGISSIGLFGSYSKDKGHNKSDIDIIIETKEPDFFKFVHIKDDLEKLFNKTVDIPRLAKEIDDNMGFLLMKFTSVILGELSKSVGAMSTL